MAALDSQQSLSSQGSASLATSSSYATSSRSPENDDASSLSSSGSEESEESKEPEPYQLPHDRAVAAMPDEDEDDGDDLLPVLQPWWRSLLAVSLGTPPITPFKVLLNIMD